MGDQRKHILYPFLCLAWAILWHSAPRRPNCFFACLRQFNLHLESLMVLLGSFMKVRGSRFANACWCTSWAIKGTYDLAELIHFGIKGTSLPCWAISISQFGMVVQNIFWLMFLFTVKYFKLLETTGVKSIWCILFSIPLCISILKSTDLFWLILQIISIYIHILVYM